MKIIFEKIELLTYSLLLVVTSLFALLVSICYVSLDKLQIFFQYIQNQYPTLTKLKTQNKKNKKEKIQDKEGLQRTKGLNKEQRIVEQESAHLMKAIEKVGQKNKSLSDLIFQMRLVAINVSAAAEKSRDQKAEFRIIAKEIKLLSSLAEETTKEVRELIQTSIKSGEKLAEKTHGNIVKKVDDCTHKMKDDISMSKKLQGEYKEILKNLDKMTQEQVENSGGVHSKNSKLTKKLKSDPAYKGKLRRKTDIQKKQIDNAVVEIKHFIEERNRNKPLDNKVLKEFKNNVIDITHRLDQKKKSSSRKSRKQKRFVRK